MSNELEPGCLAIIIESALGINIGRIVTCVRIKGEHTLYGKVWTVYSKEQIASEYGAMGHNVDVPAKWLRKIDPNEKIPDKITARDIEHDVI